MRKILAGFLTVLPLFSASPATRQFATHYIAPGSGAHNRLIAADPAGNYFVVSTISTGAAQTSVHVTKTDPAGKTLATFDFGGSAVTNPVAAATDANGNLLIGGTSNSPDFPLASPLQTTGLAFLIKLDTGLAQILYSTRLATPYIPQFFDSSVNAIALDAIGNIYLAGNTGPGLPVTNAVFQPQVPAGSTSRAYGFVAEISPDGSRQLFSTYYTGSLALPPPVGLCWICPYVPPTETLPNAIAVDSTGSILIAGTTSDAIPVTSGALAQQCNCGYSSLDGFVAKLSPGGAQLTWGTYLPLSDPNAYGNSPYENGVSVQAIALNSDGNITLAGYAPKSFPITAGALQSAFPAAPAPADGTYVAAQAGFIATLSSDGSTLLHSTYFGGHSVSGSSVPPYSGVASLAIDSDGTIWVTGGSAVAGLPSTSQPALGQNYVAALSPDLSTLSALYTVPDGAAGTAIALGSQGALASIGSGAALLTGQTGTGPSILGVSPTVAYSVSDLTAPFELITIYGLNIGPAVGLGAQIDSRGFISRSLGDVQVLFDGAPAALLYAGPDQINAIVPSGTRGPTAALQIVTPAGTLDGPVLSVHQLLPGIFTNIGGFPTPALNQDGTINSPSNPAPPGSIVAVWLTGMGSAGGFDNLINSATSSPLAISVLGPSAGPGLTSVAVLYAGSAPDQPSGISQINFVLPAQNNNYSNYMTLEVQTYGVSSTPFNIYVK